VTRCIFSLPSLCLLFSFIIFNERMMMVSVGDEIYDDDFTLSFYSSFFLSLASGGVGEDIGVSGSYLLFVFGLVFLLLHHH
jgi:hypothetical protein